jgi:hypothetical protein
MLSLWLWTGFAQDSYFVTIVKGSATKTDKAAIKPGSKLLVTEKINLGSKESMLVLLHPSKGRFVVTAQNAKESKDNMFTVLIKDFLELHEQNVRLSSRAIDEYMVSLEDYFRTDPSINSRFLIIDTLRVQLPGRNYTKADNKENFFFLQLVAPKPVNHKLKAENNSLIITREDIVFKDSLYNKTMGQLNLAYIENYSGDRKIKLITSLEPAFITRAECSEVIRGIRTALKDSPDKEILKELLTQIYYAYGKPDENTLTEIYRTTK